MKKSDFRSRFCALTKTDPKRFDSILSQVMENRTVLEGCSGHDFVKEEETSHRYRCRACGGTADATAVFWYNIGVAHGSKSSTGDCEAEPVRG